MIEFCFGFIIGIIAGSLMREDIYEEEKKSNKDKKHSKNKG